jgi:hypothetical protein
MKFLKMEIKLTSKQKMKRQGLVITLAELTKLKQELIAEARNLNKKLGLNKPVDYDRKWQINIINKEGLSDTWEIET